MPEYVFINGKAIDLTTRSSRLRDRYTTQPKNQIRIEISYLCF